jgi:hypothetical protein
MFNRTVSTADVYCIHFEVNEILAMGPWPIDTYLRYFCVTPILRIIDRTRGEANWAGRAIACPLSGTNGQAYF